MMLIRNGHLIDPAADRDGPCDILIEAGRVRDIQPPGGFARLTVPETIDARGRWILPGLIDLHVHLREPGFEWKETVQTGTEAAVLGGFTSICCMPNTNPTNDCAEVTRYIREKAEQAGLARVLPIGSVSLGLKGKQLAPLSELKHAGCVAFSDDGEPVYDAGMMRRALEWASMLGATISCHEEDKSLSCGGCMHESHLSMRLGLKGMPAVAEDVMVARDIELARVTKAKTHICHVSSARSIELIRRAKADGIPVTCEVTPHHLALTEDAVVDYDTNCKMSPPLRSAEDRDALFQGLVDGTVDAIASDHAPHELDSKRKEFSLASFGILGLQTSLPLLLEFVAQGKLTRKRAVELLTSGPARCFGLAAGTLNGGAVADLAIVDPEFSWTFTKDVIRSKSHNSPFMGRAFRGSAESVLVGGKIVVRDRVVCSG